MFKSHSQNLKALRNWLCLTAFMVFAMMLIGAVTRLTGAGLSMVEWRLIGGILPPIDSAEWNRIFALYKAIPQYRDLNVGMTLGEFKTIFWWEYIHRLWGRAIGIVYMVGLCYFTLIRKRVIPMSRLPHFLAVLLLGSLQAGLGWWMVKSGFHTRSYVAPYRLMLHLGLAFIIWGYLVWLAAEVNGEIKRQYRNNADKSVRSLATGMGVLIFILVLSGALVAGLKGGLVYNSWPLMGEKLIPADYFADYFTDSGILTNAIENPVAAQFHHRWFAVIVFLMAIAYRIRLRFHKISANARLSANLLIILFCVQAFLGILTLVYLVPTTIAVLHQAGAALLFATAVRHRRDLAALG